MSKTMTVITMYVYHDGIDDTEILESAQFGADTIAHSLIDDTDTEVDIPEGHVRVHTAPFKVE